MNLYLLTQNVNKGYDTYDSVVVAAQSEEEARLIHPSGYRWVGSKWIQDRYDGSTFEEGILGPTWTTPDTVEVELIGVAVEGIEPGIVVASFNAG